MNPLLAGLVLAAKTSLNHVGLIALIAVAVLMALWVTWEVFLRTRKKCTDCAKGIEKSANACPPCGYRFSPSPGP
ncbi:MAG: hypothetical protein ACRDPE_23570 [Solirubrobacterales bacterium]